MHAWHAIWWCATTAYDDADLMFACRLRPLVANERQPFEFRREKCMSRSTTCKALQQTRCNV